MFLWFLFFLNVFMNRKKTVFLVQLLLFWFWWLLQISVLPFTVDLQFFAYYVGSTLSSPFSHDFHTLITLAYVSMIFSCCFQYTLKHRICSSFRGLRFDHPNPYQAESVAYASTSIRDVVDSYFYDILITLSVFSRFTFTLLFQNWSWKDVFCLGSIVIFCVKILLSSLVTKQANQLCQNVC